MVYGSSAKVYDLPAIDSRKTDIIRKKHERYPKALRGRRDQESSSILFGGPDHSTEGAGQSGDSLRSALLLSPSDRAVLHTHSFPGPEVRSRLLPTAHRWRGQESVFSELQGIARHGLRDAGRHFGVRRQWSRLSYTTG